jgi:endonuclease III
MCEAQEQLERVIARMQAIQTAIKASGQPASMFELEELKGLGREYARLVDDLTNTSAGPSRA